MTKLIRELCLVLLSLCCHGIIVAQNAPTLGTARNLPPDYWGMNGTNTINDGHGWNTINTPVHDLDINGLAVQNMRYPGGTVSNYWDWREGYLMKRLPSGYNFPDNLQGRHDNFYDPAFVWDIEKPDNKLRQFRRSLMKNGGSPVFNVNMMTSGFHDQLAMMYHARELNIPVRYIELGNEFYNGSIDHVKRFDDVSVYASDAFSWAEK
jgi:hypothetical protein